MGKIIMIASGKGGTGKTTLSANLGAALAMHGKLVLLSDMDIGLRNLDVALGLESNIVYDILDVLDGNCTLDEAIVKDNRYENLYFMAAPQTRSAAEADTDKLKELWTEIKGRFDYCITDAPAGIEGGFGYAMLCADAAIIVTIPETAALRDADRVITILEENGIADIRLVLNRIRPDMIEKGIMMNIDSCLDILQIPVLGIVCEDEQLTVSALKGSLAVSEENSKAGTAFKNTARRLLGEEVPIMNMEEKKQGFFEKLKLIFSKRN